MNTYPHNDFSHTPWLMDSPLQKCNIFFKSPALKNMGDLFLRLTMHSGAHPTKGSPVLRIKRRVRQQLEKFKLPKVSLIQVHVGLPFTF